MITPSNIIVDISVFAKWFLPDEHDTEPAFKIKKDYVDENVVISLPSVAIYEMNNAFRSAVMRSRISVKYAIEEFNTFMQLDFNIYKMDELQEKILKNAIKLNLSSYDAAYVVLSEYLQIPFYTADHKLANKAKSKLVINLKQYLSN